VSTNGGLGAERILVEVIFNEKDSHRSCRGSNHQRDGNCNVQQRERLVGLVVSWRSGCGRRNWCCRREYTGTTAVLLPVWLLPLRTVRLLRTALPPGLERLQLGTRLLVTNWVLVVSPVPSPTG
jgi:hypothetical protein